jgi:hypothetical protein
VTNYEKLKTMTIEELVESGVISSSCYYGQVPAYKWDNFDRTYYGDDKLGCRQWLESKAIEVEKLERGK